jgi:membrane associated rhomboid family serine protease
MCRNTTSRTTYLLMWFPSHFNSQGHMNISDAPSQAGQADNTADTLVPWMAPDAFQLASAGQPYGYKSGKQTIRCSREQLIKEVGDDSAYSIRLVWTPDNERLVTPQEVAFLFEAVCTREKSHHRQALRTSVLMTILFGTMATLNSFSTTRSSMSIWFNVLVLGLLPIAGHIWQLWRLRSFTPEVMARQIGEARYHVWVGTRRVRLMWAMALCITLISIVQLWSGLAHFGERGWSTVQAAGLVKPAVWSGEVWRLLTASLLHGSIFHFLFNITALLVLGTFVEAVAHRAYLALVFLLSALTGSLFSLLLLPNVPSVGASGGLLGLIGFLIVLGLRYRHAIPPEFVRSLLGSVGTIAVIGVLAYSLIDNAAHLGGLLAGVGLGVLLIDGRSRYLPLRPAPLMRYAGALAAAIILAGTGGALVAIITAR